MKWYHRFKQTEKECEKIESKFVPRFDSFQKSIDGMNKSVTGLLIYLKSKDKTMDTSLFQSQSPFQLTDLGRKLLEESGGKKFVDGNIEYLIQQMDKEDLKSALDVENTAMATILFFSDLDAYTQIKDFIYNYPVYKVADTATVNIEISTMANVLGIYLRDLYFQRHPEFVSHQQTYKP